MKNDDHYNCNLSSFDFYDHYPCIKRKNISTSSSIIECYYLLNDDYIIVSSKIIFIYKYDSALKKLKLRSNYSKFITIMQTLILYSP
jgi:hypothetical protein